MERTFALKAQDQSAWLRHLCRVILDGFARFKHLGDVFRGDMTFKHTLDGVDAEEDFRIVQWEIILLHLHIPPCS